MNDQELRARLPAAQGTVTISQTTLGAAAVTQMLELCYGEQSIVITGAQPDPSVSTGVAFTGRSTFLNAADCPVSARFWVDAAGEVHALLRYQLRDLAPGPMAWTFSRGFPTLPPVLDWSSDVPPIVPGVTTSVLMNGQRPFLDALDLFDTWLVVTTHDGTDPLTGQALVAGINFASQLRPHGTLGVLEQTLGDQPVLPLRGVIRLPRATDRQISLRPRERVWDRQDLPGIHLWAALGTAVKLGGVTLKDAAFRAYSPTSREWMEKNRFQPTHGYTGTLAIPSAGIEVKLGADLEWNLPQAMLYGDCSGVSLKKLTDLLDLTGTDGLSSQLPSELKTMVEAASRLELMQVSLQVGLNGTAPAVQAMSCTVGFPELRWKVWGDHLVVESLACRFGVTSPWAAPTPSAAAGGGGSALGSAAPPVSVTVLGTLSIEGTPLFVSASNDDGFTIRAQTGAAVKLPVDKLVKSFAPRAAAPSPLAVSYLGVTVVLGKYYEMTALLAGAPDPWVIPVGKVPLTVSDVMMSVSCAQGADPAVHFSGRIALSDQVVLEAAYDSPGDFLVKSTFRKIKLGELVGRLCDAKPGGPADFDLTIESATVQIQKRGDSYVMLTVGTVKGFGVVAVEVRRVGGQWGFATGVDIAGGKLSQVPGLGGLKAIEDLVRLDKLMLIVSTFDDAAFQFPDQAKFRRTGVTKGLMAAAEWTLRADDKKENLLMKLLGAGATQSVALAVGANPATDSRMYVESRSTIQGQPFVYRFGVEMTGGAPNVFLSGTLSVKVLGTMQTFDVLGTFSAGGLMMAASMKGATALDFKAFKLSNVAVQIGVNWAGIPSLGLAGTIDVKKFESSLAVFFDSTDPAKSLVAGSVSPLTLKDVMDTMLGALVQTPMDEVLETVSIQGTHTFTVPGALGADLDGLVFDKVSAAFSSSGKVSIPAAASSLLLVVNAKGSSWHLTDLTAMKHYELRKKGDQIEVSLMPQFYFAPAPTRIGSTTYRQGYSLNGALNFAGFKASASIDIATSKGVSVEAQMDRVVIGNQDLFCIEAEQGGGGPKVSISTYSQPDNPVQQLRAPHFYVNGKLSMLGVKQGVFASLTTKGLWVEVRGTVAPGTTLDVHAIAGGSGLDLGGSVKVGVGTIDLGELGKIKVNTDVEGAMGISANAQKIDAWVEGGLQFMGSHIQIGRAKLDTSPDAIAKLSETMAKKVEVELRKLFADANKWANAVKGGLVDGVNDTAKVFTNVYKKSAKEAEDMADDISGGVKDVAKDAGKAISSGAKSVGKKLKKLF